MASRMHSIGVVVVLAMVAPLIPACIDEDDIDDSTKADTCGNIITEIADVRPRSTELAQYADAVQARVAGLDERFVETRLGATRAEAASCLLKLHAAVDSIVVSPTGSGVSVHDRENMVWINLLLVSE